MYFCYAKEPETQNRNTVGFCPYVACSSMLFLSFLFLVNAYGGYLVGTVLVILLYIRKTCPCNVYPLKPHFYIAKLGYAGVYLFFLLLLQNIAEAVLTCTHNICFEQK